MLDVVEISLCPSHIWMSFSATPSRYRSVAQEIPPRAGEMSRSDKRGPSAGEAMPQIVKADSPKSVLFQKDREMRRQIFGLNELSELVDVYIIL